MTPSAAARPSASARIEFLILLTAFAFGFLTQSSLAQGTDDEWTSIGNAASFNGQVRSIVEDEEGNLYYGGHFTTVDGITVNRVAKWDGVAWSALGSGTNGNVHALAVSGTTLYAAGPFGKAGGRTVFGIAEWNGVEWSPLSLGLNGGGTPYSLAVSGDELYMGGNFTSVSGVSAKGIAKWDGTSWSALGSGVTGFVNSISINGSSVYAGGYFSGPGSNVAVWSGTEWAPLGAGLDDGVATVHATGSDVYAGGVFYQSDGTAIGNRISRWNGTNWNPVGSGMNGQVRTIVSRDDDIYAGGSFSRAGGVSCSRIAKWDGSNWSPLGSGTDDDVTCLHISTLNLNVGGNFDTAGGEPAGKAADVIIAYESDPIFDLETFGSLEPGDTINLGSISIDSTGTGLLLGIVNLGNREIPATAFSLSGDDSSLFAIDTTDYIPGLGTENRGTILITASPMELGEFSAVLNVDSGNPDGEIFTFPLVTTGVESLTLYEAAASEAGLVDSDALPDASPFGDGLENLLKYAFNLDLSKADARGMPFDGDAGLPTNRIEVIEGVEVWQFQYLRRTGSGLIYTPQKAPTLNDSDFVDILTPPTVERVEALWERATITIPRDPSVPKCFGRVSVELP